MTEVRDIDVPGFERAPAPVECPFYSRECIEMSAQGIARTESLDSASTVNTTAEEEKIFSTDAEAPEVTATAIAQRAYQLWEERGCPYGCPEEDWFRAENELRRDRRSVGG